MTFPGQLPSCVFAMGDHVFHERRRRKGATEAERLTDKLQNESRVSLSLLTLSWRNQSQDQNSRLPHCSHKEIFASSQNDVFQ